MDPMPVFQKILTPSDVNDRLCFPTRHLHIFPFQGDERDLEFYVSPCEAGRPLWRLCLTRRASNNPKPVITRASWTQIVKFGKLEAGDRLSFFVDDDEFPRRYKIMVERIGIKLLGKVIHRPDGIWYRLI